jgi:CHAD domain-containing protein
MQASKAGPLPEQLTPDSPLWAWAYDAIGHRAETMVSHLEGVRLGEDIEAVHDMRVWSRRLVAAMRVFGACFPGPEYRSLVREARQVTRRLGAVRDLDVLIDYFARRRPEAESAALLGIDYLLARLGREREKARKPMLRAMDELIASDYPGRLREYLRDEAQSYALGLHPPALSSEVDPKTPFRTVAPALLEERYREFYAFEPYVANAEAVTELHEMRIAAKWLRYTMELFAPAYADELKQPLAVVKRFQELLGDLHDADVRLDLLRESIEGRLDARALGVLGLMLPEPVQESLVKLAEAEQGVRDGCYRAFYKEWRKQERRGFAASARERILDPNAEER